MSPLEVRNQELFGFMAFAFPLLAIWGCVLFRLDRAARGKGYQSPFRGMLLTLAFLTSLGGGFWAAAHAPGLCWDCSPAKSPEAFQQQLAGAKVGQFSKYFLAGSIGPVIAAAAAVFLLPRRARRFGERRVRMPWRNVATLFLLLMVLGTIAALVWRPGFSVWFRLAVLLGAGYRAADYLAKRLKAPDLRSALLADPRAPVFYLREFDKEDEMFAALSYDECETLGVPMVNATAFRHPATLEQYFDIEIRQKIGPFVALGDPYDYAPPGGASREYFEDDGWKAAFGELARKSRFIVMRAGKSENLRLELEMLRDSGMLHKLFTVTGPDRKRPILPQSWRTYLERKRWAEFSSAMSAAGLTPCAYPGPGAAVGFAGSTAVAITAGAITPAQYVKAILNRCDEAGAAGVMRAEA